MKKLILITLASIFTISCTKNLIPVETSGESTLTINLSGTSIDSKSTGSGHGNQADDNYVNTLDIFVFNAAGENAGELDAYKRFTASDGITNLQLKATTGNKKIYVVANSHRSDWKGINTLAAFQAVQTSLQKDDVKNFIMTGNIDVTLQATTSVNIPISRLTARVQLASIKTAFAGGPYAGLKLTNVKVFLLNVHSVKNIHDGNITTPVILNSKALNGVDVNSCIMLGMLYDAVTPAIDDTGYQTPHYFYAYENTLETETADNRFTRLVIQADLNGKTYYYPVNINREGYGYVAANGHKGVKRNTTYEINVTIMRPGSTDPDKPIQYGTLNVSLNVQNWVVTPVANPEF